MAKNRFYSEFDFCELIKGFEFMELELENAPIWIIKLFDVVKSDFINDRFTYDGATFVKNRSSNTIFEVAAFIHDWFNYNGFVSYKVDDLMLIIMRELNYRKSSIITRWILTRLTFLNIIRHKVKGTYKGKLPIELILK